MAVFAPNGVGKSSLVDSFEYYFSEEPTLERLGGKASTRAGPTAMEHVDAKKVQITPEVHFWFRQGDVRFDDSRPVPGPLARAARRVIPHIRVPLVIRGYDLRRFAESDTPGARYRDLAKWFSLDPLLNIQDNLRALRRKVKEMAESTSEKNERLHDLERVTDNRITDWDEVRVRDWFNGTILSHLDASFVIDNFSDESPEFQELVRRERKEQEQAGLAQLKQLSGLIENLLDLPMEQGRTGAGQIAAFEEAALNLRHAADNEKSEKSEASDAVFNQVWESAQKLFGSDAPFDICPVCDTRFSTSPCRSRAGVHDSLRKHLFSLTEYRAANAKLVEAEKKLNTAVIDLRNGLENMPSLLDASGYQCNEVSAYLEALQSWDVGEDPPESSSAAVLADILSSVRDRVAQIEQDRGDNTYAQALETARDLIRIRTDLKRIMRTKANLKDLEAGILQQTGIIDKAIMDRVQGLIRELQDHTNDLYKALQGTNVAAPPIRLELPGNGSIEHRQVKLLIDFGDRSGVVPSGYLSDSQIHTVALALRLSAICMLNSGFQIMVLDDVVTSYDVDRRKNIARVLGECFDDFQIVLVTHDEQFFNMLPDHLHASHWSFKRITDLRPGFGPHFADHRTRDQTIERMLKRNRSAAVEIRMAEEEWLYRICIDFETKVAMLPATRRHERSELAGSLSSFLSSARIEPPRVPGTHNKFLATLQRGVVENLGSHFSDSPYSSGSIGDERERWEEFKNFRDMFACSCGSCRFKRPRSMSIPVCKSCEKRFDFV